MGHLKKMAESVTQCFNYNVYIPSYFIQIIKSSKPSNIYRIHSGMQNNNTDATLHFGKLAIA